jgi:hypothetical protein
MFHLKRKTVNIQTKIIDRAYSEKAAEKYLSSIGSGIVSKLLHNAGLSPGGPF